MKRFTETEKWRDPWFRRLPHTLKLGYLYLLDSVDNAGVWDPDYEAADFIVGIPVSWTELMAAMGPRLEVLKNGKWHLTKFVGYQFGDLSDACKPHAQVLRLMAHHGIKRSPKGYPKGIHTPKDKDKDKDKDQDTDTEPAKDPIQLRAEAIFKRRPETPLTAGEERAFAKSRGAIEATTEADWLLLEAFYAAPQSETFTRTDLATLVNNWNGEIDRARAWQAKGGNRQEQQITLISA